MRRVSLLGLAICGVLLVSIPGAFGAGGGAAADPGVKPTSITIGGTFALTGPASGYAPIPGAMKAYFSYINARRGPDGKRGVYGRQIVFKFYDDGYNPANSVQLTRKLVEEDKVFAVVGSLGTEVNEAIQPYLNEKKVPHVLIASGASEWGTNYKKYPWSIGFLPDYIGEGRIYGQNIAKFGPTAKVGVIYQNDSYGKDYLVGFKEGLGRKVSQIVAEVPFEVTSPTPAAEVAKLKASGADTLVIFVTPKGTIQTFAFAKALGWAPTVIYVNSVSATQVFMKTAAGAAGDLVNNALSVTYLKDPASPTYANDAAIKEYKALLAKYAPAASPTDQLNVYGFASAETFVQALYKAGKNPTRASLMAALTSLNSTNRFLLAGVKLKTSSTDRFVISQSKLINWGGGATGSWKEVSDLIESRP
ncbi:MAG: ABC transporter substrate-binding protein [Actinobacteria bacterium]|nr:ABC transporter substrate-binding protein [Actinomycetota bacterium]